jgi:hypothetical protein
MGLAIKPGNYIYILWQPLALEEERRLSASTTYTGLLLICYCYDEDTFSI